MTHYLSSTLAEVLVLCEPSWTSRDPFGWLGLIITQSLEQIRTRSFLSSFYPKPTLEPGLWHLTHLIRNEGWLWKSPLVREEKQLKIERARACLSWLSRTELACASSPSFLGTLCYRHSWGKGCTKRRSALQPPLTASFSHSSTQHRFIEQLSCARHSSKSWRRSSEHERQGISSFYSIPCSKDTTFPQALSLITYLQHCDTCGPVTKENIFEPDQSIAWSFLEGLIGRSDEKGAVSFFCLQALFLTVDDDLSF